MIFNDKGWPAIQEKYRLTAWLSAINIAVFSLAVVLAIGFSVYLFISRKKREYAIMRALGVPKGASARALVLPLMSIATVSILAGSGAAWVYTARTVGQTNAMLILEAYAIDVAMPVGVALGCISAELLLTLLIALMMLRRIGKAQPLALLHGQT